MEFIQGVRCSLGLRKFGVSGSGFGGSGFRVWEVWGSGLCGFYGGGLGSGLLGHGFVQKRLSP